MVSIEETRAAAGAERLLADEILTGALDELVRQSTEQAVFAVDPQHREDARQQVLAIGRLRGALQGAIEYVLGQRDEARRNRELEQ